MVLAMSRPFAHPKTGVYWLRKVVPANLCAVVGKRELKATLETKDQAEAKRRMPAVLERFDGILTAARTGERRASERAIQAICGQWYREQDAQLGDEPGPAVNWEAAQDEIEGSLDPGETWTDAGLSAEARQEAARLLERSGHLADPVSVRRLGTALLATKHAFAATMARRARGDWSQDGVQATFPSVVPSAAPPPPAGISIGNLVH